MTIIYGTGARREQTATILDTIVSGVVQLRLLYLVSQISNHVRAKGDNLAWRDRSHDMANS